MNGDFNELSTAAATAIASVLVSESSAREVRRAPVPLPELQVPFDAVQRAAGRLAAVYADARLETDQAEYVQRFQGGLMNVVYAWCKGKPFSELCKMCDIFEGSIQRWYNRARHALRRMHFLTRFSRRVLQESDHRRI